MLRGSCGEHTEFKTSMLIDCLGSISRTVIVYGPLNDSCLWECFSVIGTLFDWHSAIN